jgi:probable rRNA maturation factor
MEPFVDGVRQDQLSRIVERAIAMELGPASALPSIVIADDATVRDLNRRHRGLDEATDVLAFSFRHEGEYYGPEAPSRASPDPQGFVLPPGEVEGLGEVIVSYPQAERQAAAAGHSVDREMALLVAHGVLHLLGYDHLSAEDGVAMRAKEEMVLAKEVSA